MSQRLAILVLVLLLALPLVGAAAESAATQPAAIEVKSSTIATQPTLVSVKLDKVPASEMFNKLSSEAKISLTAQNDGLWDDQSLQEASFSIEWDKQPLWSAIKEACDAAGTRIMPDDSYEGAGRVQLVKGSLPASTCIDGPVMIWACSLTRSAQISYADGTHKPDEVRLRLMVLPEPKLRRWAWYGRLKIQKAEDEQGHSLLSPAAPTQGSTNGADVPVILEYPPKVGGKLAVLIGSISIEVVSEVKTISYHPPFEDLKETATDVGNDRLVFKHARKDPNGGYHFEFNLLRGKDEPIEHWAPIGEPFSKFGAPMALIGLRGETHQNGGMSGAGSDEAHCDLYFNPREAGDEATELRVVMPIKFSTLTAKFEFKDLPLP